mmetsp:Transcript_158925/g.509804  ORF Transcript_158925/g.509804 Transcript_158925/m.509804 type:complete len:242 (-) Transcript_158925:129-854(-)
MACCQARTLSRNAAKFDLRTLHCTMVLIRSLPRPSEDQPRSAAERSAASPSVEEPPGKLASRAMSRPLRSFSTARCQAATRTANRLRSALRTSTAPPLARAARLARKREDSRCQAARRPAIAKPWVASPARLRRMSSALLKARHRPTHAAQEARRARSEAEASRREAQLCANSPCPWHRRATRVGWRLLKVFLHSDGSAKPRVWPLIEATSRRHATNVEHAETKSRFAKRTLACQPPGMLL